MDFDCVYNLEIDFEPNRTLVLFLSNNQCTISDYYNSEYYEILLQLLQIIGHQNYTEKTELN